MAKIDQNKYYTLITKDSKYDTWAIQFGDFDKSVVVEETNDCYKDYYWKCKVICSKPGMSDILEAVAKENADSLKLNTLEILK